MARCDSYDDGQCTRGACDESIWVPDYLGNAGEWAANAPAHGLQVTMVPTVGSIVVYCGGDGYSVFGHCGRVLEVFGDGSFEVREMNFAAAFVYDERHSSAFDVCGFVLPPGVQPGQGGGGSGGRGAGIGADGLPGELKAVWAEITEWANRGGPYLMSQVDGWRSLIRSSAGL